MQRIVLLLVSLFATAAASAAVNLTWGTVEGAQGYKVYVQTPSGTGTAQSFAVSAPPYDVGPQLQPGVQSEIWVTSTLTTPSPYESAGQSNHIRVTGPVPPTVTTIPGPPPGITITWQ